MNEDDQRKWSEDLFHERQMKNQRHVVMGLMDDGEASLQKLHDARELGVEHLLTDDDHDVARGQERDIDHMRDAIADGKEIYGENVMGDHTPIGDDGRAFIMRNFHDRREGRL